MDGNSVSNFIRQKREELGFTTEQVAAQLGVSRLLVETWENGELPQTEYLLSLAKVLQTDVDELLIGCEETKNLIEEPVQFSEPKKDEVQADEEKGYYESLNEKIKNIDYESYELQMENRNGFFDSERKFGTLLCSIFLALFLLINVANLSAWINRPRELTLDNCNNYVSVSVYATTNSNPTVYKVELTLKKNSFPVTDLSAKVKVVFKKVPYYEVGSETLELYAEFSNVDLAVGESTTTTVTLPHFMYHRREVKIVEISGGM